MLTLPEKGGILTLLNPGPETGGGNAKSQNLDNQTVRPRREMRKCLQPCLQL